MDIILKVFGIIVALASVGVHVYIMRETLQEIISNMKGEKE